MGKSLLPLSPLNHTMIDVRPPLMTLPPPTCRRLPAPAVTHRRRRRCPPAVALRRRKVSLTHSVGTGAHRCCLLPTAICQSNMFAVNNIVTQRPPVRPPNGTRPASAPHPSEGGSRGYVQEMRDQVISLNAVWIELLRHQKKFPCLRLQAMDPSVSRRGSLSSHAAN